MELRTGICITLHSEYCSEYNYLIVYLEQGFDTLGVHTSELQVHKIDETEQCLEVQGTLIFSMIITQLLNDGKRGFKHKLLLEHLLL